MDPVTPAARDLARWLLSREAGADISSEAKGCEAARVCEKLRRPLSMLTGVDGFRSLLSRALTLARADDPSLGTVQVKDDGSLEGLCLVEPQTDPDSGSKRGEILVARLIGLLIRFIGYALTLRLVRDIWPDAPSIDTDPAMEKKP